jgi:acyl dehydratase
MKPLLYLDDLFVGRRFVSGALALTAEEITKFAATFDPQPFHLDEATAKSTFFGGLAASGWHTAAITMKLIVGSVPLAGGLIGAGGEIAWPAPVRPGDSLTVETEVIDTVPSHSHPERGTAVLRIETRNQAGVAVQILTIKVVVPVKPAKPEEARL